MLCPLKHAGFNHCNFYRTHITQFLTLFFYICSLGKTLECIGLISVHPHSPQPFSTAGFATGSVALTSLIKSSDVTALNDAVTSLARIPTLAKDM